MDLINEYKTETIYELNITEKELGTLLVALGAFSYDNLKGLAGRNYVKIDILDRDRQHELYSYMLQLLNVEPK